MSSDIRHNVAIQTVLTSKEQISTGISLGILVRSLGGSVAVAICQNVFESKFRGNLANILPEVDVSVISGSGATTPVPDAEAALGGNKGGVEEVLNLYNEAVVQTFSVALILAALILPAALLVGWKGVRKEKKEDIESEEAIEKV